MKKNRIPLWIFGMLAVCAVSSLAAYFISRTAMPEPPKAAEELSEETPGIPIYHDIVMEEDAPADTPKAAVIYYSLQSQDNFLILYEVNGEQKTEVRRLPFEKTLYPEEDLSELAEGIRADSLEEGIQIMENFTS